MDGFGLAPEGRSNAIATAKTPVLDEVFATNPRTMLQASGLDVGLPSGQMGNSEVGHTNIGAGRVVFQDLPKISKAITDGDFFTNKAYLDAINHAKETGGNLHIFGLMSDGGVHSHISHIHAMIEMCSREGLKGVFVHCFMDGRDTPPESGAGYVESTVECCKKFGGQVGTVIGRYYAMDRDNRWERVVEAYSALVYGEGKQVDCPVKGVKESYAEGVTDEFIKPIVVDGYQPIKDGDSIVFMNFRPDRAREITRTFVDPEFSGFERKKGFFRVHYVCTTQYDADMPGVHIAFEKEELTNTFGEYVSRLGLKQLRIAETEKYAHVTFFFNGGVEKQYEGEDRVLVPSPKVATYDLQPEMSAYEVCDQVVERIGSGEYDVIILNFANCDMVGHTGVFDAAVAAVEAVDTCVGRVLEAMKAMGGISLITADHGNADCMYDEDGTTPFTAHTTNPVPFVIVGADVKLEEGRLCDIAPTMLDLMGLGKPDEMTGKSLIK